MPKLVTVGNFWQKNCCLSNFSAKNYQNQLMFIQVIMCYIAYRILISSLVSREFRPQDCLRSYFLGDPTPMFCGKTTKEWVLISDSVVQCVQSRVYEAWSCDGRRRFSGDADHWVSCKILSVSRSHQTDAWRRQFTWLSCTYIGLHQPHLNLELGRFG